MVLLHNKRGPIIKIKPHTFEPGYLFGLRMPVGGEISEPGYLFGLRMPVSGETFTNRISNILVLLLYVQGDFMSRYFSSKSLP